MATEPIVHAFAGEQVFQKYSGKVFVFGPGKGCSRYAFSAAYDCPLGKGVKKSVHVSSLW
jgi:hypothetical protein